MTDLVREIHILAAAAQWAGGLTRAIADEAWEGPGLGGWNLRALVGHTSRALLTVEQCLAMPAEAEQIESAEAYFESVTRSAVSRSAVSGSAVSGSAVSGNAADPAAILQRGIDAGAALGQDPAAEFARIVERVVRRVRAADDRLVTTIAGGMRLSQYLPTRTFELVVHGLDIARAVGVSDAPPEPALRRALVLATALAARAGHGSEVLLALTGRGAVGPGFSVVP